MYFILILFFFLILSFLIFIFLIFSLFFSDVFFGAKKTLGLDFWLMDPPRQNKHLLPEWLVVLFPGLSLNCYISKIAAAVAFTQREVLAFPQHEGKVTGFILLCHLWLDSRVFKQSKSILWITHQCHLECGSDSSFPMMDRAKVCSQLGDRICNMSSSRYFLMFSL